MSSNDSATGGEREARGLVLGSIAVVAFSFTPPATKLAVAGFGGALAGLIRPLIAASLAGAILLARRERLPARSAWAGLAVVGLGGVLGFPMLTSLALDHVPSIHVAVISGILPAATAGLAVLRARERPSIGYWMSMGLGLTGIVAFTMIQGGGRIEPGDLLLIAGMLCASVAYTEGALLARSMGGWRVMCWALVLSAPVLAPALLWAIGTSGAQVHVGTQAVAGLVYVSAVSALFAFFAWYSGLAMGGVARVGQIQLAQPVLTLLWSWLLLGESVGAVAMVACSVVVLAVALGRRAVIRPAA